MLKATLCHIREANKILLQKKSAGRFGEGKWNAVGGKILPDETPIEGAIREVREETGLRVKELQEHGYLKFYFGEESEPNWIVYVFSTYCFEGMLNPSEEGFLKWFEISEIPYQQMWEDDRYWLPHMLNGTRFNGDFFYGKNDDKLVGHEFKIL